MIGIIFGPPGSGKGTQAARIEDAFRLKHLSTGDILRAEVARGTPVGKEVGRIMAAGDLLARGTPVGKEVGRIMAAGDLVPDELIVDIVRGRLPEAEAGEGVLLDGFPRTVGQAQALDNMLSDEGHKVDFVVALDVPEAELVDRLLHRAEVEGREDDTRQAIEERMHEYHKLTEAVLDHYRRKGVPVQLVSGVGSPDQVFGRIRRAVGISSA